jgi:large subunit ribosomal protein L21
MYAVIETGGKQYRVAPGDTIRVDTVSGEPGTQVELVGRILAVMGDDEQLLTGDRLTSAKVSAVIGDHGRGDKVIVFKFKRKKQYKRTIGHRQNYTELKISDITV